MNALDYHDAMELVFVPKRRTRWQRSSSKCSCPVWNAEQLQSKEGHWGLLPILGSGVRWSGRLSSISSTIGSMLEKPRDDRCTRWRWSRSCHRSSFLPPALDPCQFQRWDPWRWRSVSPSQPRVAVIWRFHASQRISQPGRQSNSSAPITPPSLSIAVKQTIGFNSDRKSRPQS